MCDSVWPRPCASISGLPLSLIKIKELAKATFGADGTNVKDIPFAFKAAVPDDDNVGPGMLQVLSPPECWMAVLWAAYTALQGGCAEEAVAHSWGIRLRSLQFTIDKDLAPTEALWENARLREHIVQTGLTVKVGALDNRMICALCSGAMLDPVSELLSLALHSVLCSELLCIVLRPS